MFQCFISQSDLVRIRLIISVVLFIRFPYLLLFSVAHISKISPDLFSGTSTKNNIFLLMFRVVGTETDLFPWLLNDNAKKPRLVVNMH